MRVLNFVEPSLDGYLAAVLDAVRKGAQALRLYPDSRSAVELAEAVRVKLPDSIGLEVLSSLPERVVADSTEQEIEAVYVLVPNEDEQLPELLLRFLDWDGGWLIAPQTSRYYARNPLFLISIPKAGTHLLYNLARKMGYRDGVELVSFPEPAYWYCLEYSNSHTAAPDFFIDTVRRSPLGNLAHPFPRTPALMIYRNPLDILVSEANWYHRDGKASFHGYLSGLSFEDRVERLISDPWLLGSIRERVGRFLAWLEFPNVIPLSFEELVGTRGGGDDRIQADLIWSLQLKLQVPGKPEDISKVLFDRDSPTFNEGRIHRYREVLSDSLLAKFHTLDQDFMRLFGFGGCDKNHVSFPPHRAKEFRRRPLRLSMVDTNELPYIVEVFLGCNLACFRQRFYALPQRLGEVDLTQFEPKQLESFVSATNLKDLKNLLVLGEKGYKDALRRVGAMAPEVDYGRLLFEGYRGFNLVAYEGKVLAIEMAVGPIDVRDAEVRERLTAEGRLLEAITMDGARTAVDRLLDRRQFDARYAEMAERLAKLEASVASIAQSEANPTKG